MAIKSYTHMQMYREGGSNAKENGFCAGSMFLCYGAHAQARNTVVCCVCPYLAILHTMQGIEII